MKTSIKFFLVLLFVIFNQSCSTDNLENLEILDLKGNFKGSEILIPDENFRNTLINTNCVDTNGDGIPDIDVDLNSDGEIQKSEANSVESLILHFDYGSPIKFVDLEGIENFSNTKYLKISGSGTGGWSFDEVANSTTLSYDLRKLKKLEFLSITNLASEYFDLIDLSGLIKLNQVELSGNRPMEYYDNEDQFIHINFEGVTSLKSLNTTNSFLKIDLCQIPSLEKLNMEYLEGGEPDVFDFHCLTNLKWLNISDNRIETLILKNSTVLDTFIYNYGFGGEWFYPSPTTICIDDIQEERDQIMPLVGENTVVTTQCSF